MYVLHVYVCICDIEAQKIKIVVNVSCLVRTELRKLNRKVKPNTKHFIFIIFP